MANMLAKSRKSKAMSFSPIRNVYGYYNEDGEQKFGVVGSENVDEIVKASFASTDYSILLNSFLQNPENGVVLDPAAYGDVSEIPTDILQISEIANNAKMAFQRLPLKVREQYGSDMFKFFTEVSNGEFKKKFFKSDNASDETRGKDGGESGRNVPAGNAQGDCVSTEGKGADGKGGSGK